MKMRILSLYTLVLILKGRTIRFNCLDKVDDIEKGNTEPQRIIVQELVD